jgi:cytochrome P450
VLVGHPEGVRETLGTRAASFAKERSQGLRVLLGDGLITSDGMEHARQRRRLQPVLFAAHRADWTARIVTATARSTSFWSDGEIRDVQADMLRLHRLARDPALQEALVREAAGVLGGRPPVSSDIPRLTLSRAVFAESLRLYPPAWIISRQALAGAQIGGTAIKRGTVVLLSPWVIHRDARWYRDPLAFEPRRWLAGRPSSRPFAYLPFGAGARRCVGEPLAWLEGTLALALITSNWTFGQVGTAEPSFRLGISLASREGLPVLISRRDRRVAVG